MNAENLKKDIDKLVDLFEHATSKTKKAYYLNTIKMLSIPYTELTGDGYEMDTIESRKSYDAIDCFASKEFNWCVKELEKERASLEYQEMIKELTENAIDALEGDMYFLSTHHYFSYEEGKRIILAFIEEFDDKLLPIIADALSEESLIIFDTASTYSSTADGFMFNNRPLNKMYVTLYNTKKMNMERLSILVHELGHVLQSKTYEGRDEVLYNHFLEVPSEVLSYIFLDWCYQKNIYLEDTISVINNALLNCSNWVDSLNIVNCFSERVKNNFLCLTGEDLEEEEIMALEYEKVDDYYVVPDVLDQYLYAYGTLLGFYYLERYRREPEKTKEEIYEFMKCIGVVDDQYMLQHFGVNLEEFINCDYLERVKNESQKMLRLVFEKY